MTTAIVTICNGCGFSYTDQIGVAIAIEDCPGRKWTRVHFRSASYDFCEKCATEIVKQTEIALTKGKK